MAELSTLARPYAKAAFEFAVGSGDLSGWSERLSIGASVIRQGPVRQLLASPNLTAARKAALLIDVCGDAINNVLENFFIVLSENRRLQLLPQISEQFEVLKANHEKAVDVDVLASQELASDQLEKLNSALERKLERRINLQVRLDGDLLGGVVIRAGDTVIDGSIRGRLTKLADSLNI